MTKTELLSRIDSKFRPMMVQFLPANFYSYLYSNGRKSFINMLASEIPQNVIVPTRHSKILWDIEFQSNLFNAAGMFKKGEAYYTVAAQGAGAYLAGTTTARYRRGNEKKGILHPFASYPQSAAALNWMGLPNEGHEVVAKRISGLDKQAGCPIGVSIGSSPEDTGLTALNGVLDGFRLYDKAGADFIELNESCPNVVHEHDNNSEGGLDSMLVERLEFISENFLSIRDRNLPVILKISTDTEKELIPLLINKLSELEFDGINIGNTSTDYESARTMIAPNEMKTFDYFTKTFGGGLSGRPLKKKSLELSALASEYISQSNIGREFHVIRTGGVENAGDLSRSEKAGVALNQWFTGYFDAFSLRGHKLYEELLRT
ncbi:MAG: hypothetical protein PF588_08220 [Candidatus Kapabacteria bacterium]|nr:hypothetical protein [Candidatus Kapabacteria bacterium]